MNIEKNKKPIKPGQRYFLELYGTTETAEHRFFALENGDILRLSGTRIKGLWTESKPINRCRDCAHARQGSFGLRSVTCQYNCISCWDKMCKACEHFTPKEP